MKRFGFPAARVQAAAEPIFTHLLMAGSRVKISTIWLFRQAKFFFVRVEQGNSHYNIVQHLRAHVFLGITRPVLPNIVDKEHKLRYKDKGRKKEIL